MNHVAAIFCAAMFFCVFAFVAPQATAEDIDVTAPDGAPGQDGAAGDPGETGGDGAAGGDAAVDTVAPDLFRFEVFAFGGSGGAGGDGGDGDVAGANGGDGGAGANGGSAHVTVTTLSSATEQNIDAFASGGDGANGGRAGTAGMGGSNGSAGNGGRGGDAFSRVDVPLMTLGNFDRPRISSGAIAGDGGNAIGVNAFAGDGGNAVVGGSMNLVTDAFATSTNTFHAQGGDGGDGFFGADGGDGGQATVADIEIGGNGDITSTVNVTARGGDGGQALSSGNAGDGASVFLSNTVNLAPGSARLIISQKAIAGSSGAVEAGANGQVGSAVSQFRLDDDAVIMPEGSTLELETNAIGGDGGRRADTSGVAAAGGNAVSQVSARTERTTARVNARAEGGAGGDGSRGAGGGAGGDAVATSTLEYGGDGSDVFHAGNSAASATGGDSGRISLGGTVPSRVAGNALARANAVATGSGAIRASALAVGGSGGTGGVDGAAGGLARAYSAASGSADVSSSATATGGGGGWATGIGFRGADGQAGFADAYGISTNGGAVAVFATQSGGKGGSGQEGADAGNGGDVITTNRSRGQTSGVLTLGNVANGGDGGTGYGGVTAGRGGNATTESRRHHTGAHLIVRDTVNGGDGGDVREASVDDPGIAGDGGNASMSVDLISTGDVTVDLRAIGGEGGAVGRGEAGDGGNVLIDGVKVHAAGAIDIDIDAFGGTGPGFGSGGRAGTVHILQPVFAQSSDSGVVAIDLLARAGDAGREGNGGDITVVDAIDGVGDNNVMLIQAAIAGDAHTQNAAGDYRGGNAVSSLTRMLSTEMAIIETTAFGGDSPESGMMPGSMAGGLAHATSNMTNATGSVFASSDARGGRGERGSLNASINGGNGGDAFSSARAMSSGHNSTVDAQGYARGGFAGSLSGGGRAARGGNATSESVAISMNGGQANSDDEAIGGDAVSAGDLTIGGDGGAATSRATARTTGFANASSRAMGGRSASGGMGWGAGGSAMAESTAISAVSAIATATAHAGNGNGALGRAEAVARANAADSFAEARATAAGGGVIRSLSVSARSISDGDAEALAVAGAGDIGVRDINASPQGSAAIAIATPDFDDVNQVLATSPSVANHFDVGGDSTVLGYIGMSSGFSGSDYEQSNPLLSSISFTIDTEELDSEQNLLLGLFGTSIGANGFETVRFRVSVESETVIDEMFTSILEATDFFDDEIIDLGFWADSVSGDGLLSVGFMLEAVVPFADMGFGFNGIFGNSTLNAAVPLPAALWLFIAALALLPRRLSQVGTASRPAAL